MSADSLVVAGQIELLGGPGGVQNTNPLCVNAAGVGAIFRLQPGYDLGAAQPTTDFIGSLALDGERPFGRRASDRTITLPIQIVAPDFTTQAGALELLSQAIDQQTWTLTWTRDPSQASAGGLGVALPLVLDCFRAQASALTYGGVDQTLGLPIGAITITFQALPYGHSDQPVSIAVASPLPGGVTPPAPIVLDTFSSVSGTNFSQDTQHIVGPHSAKWSQSGPTNAPNYQASFAATDLSAMSVLSVWVGVGANFPATFMNPCTVQFILGDNAGKLLSFSVSRHLTPSGNASVPNWQLISAAIPQGRAFSYTHVISYFVSVFNTPNDGFGYNTWYDHVAANPPSVQTATTRGAVYNILGVAGTARAPLSLQAQQPGITKTVTLNTPGPFQWTAPAGLTGGTASVTAVGGGGAGASLVLAGEGGGGSGAEVAQEPLLGLTPGTVYSGVIGAGGTPQTGISTLAITTTGLPTATVSSVYSATLTATGGTPAYTWSHTTGVIPTGLSLSSGGVISGTPSGSAVSPSLGFTVTDSLGATATVVLVLRVVVAATFAITTTTAPAGNVGGRYSLTMTTNGVGTAPLTWSISAGTLPPGLTLGTSSGIISGIPTAAGNSTFTVMVADSSGTVKTDTQALTIVITAVSTSTLPIFGINSGAAWPPASYDDVYTAMQIGGQAVCFRFQGGKGSGPGGFPNKWNDPGSRGAKIPANATVVLGDWEQFDIPGLLAGNYDAGIKTFALSCQAQWNKNPGSIIISMWHEADHLSAGNPTPAQVRGLHAYFYPRFKQWAPSVPYGQTFSRDAVVANPSGWVSCKKTIAGGSDLDYYGVDGYAHGRTAAAVFNPAFAAIRSQVPNAVLAIPELNCEVQGATRVQWFNDAWAIAIGAQYGPLLLFQPFWMGESNGQVICWLPGDTNTINALRSIVNQAAPAGSVQIGGDPPAVNGGTTSFTGDSVTVTAAGGLSATSITGAATNAVSTNSVHFTGGAGATGATGAGGSPGTPYTIATFAGNGVLAAGGVVSVAVATSTTAGDAIAVIAGSNKGDISGVTDSQGNLYHPAVDANNAAALTGVIWVAVTAANGTSPTVKLTSGSDHVTVTYASALASQAIVIRGCSGVSTTVPFDVSLGNSGASAAPSSGSTGVLNQPSEWAIAALVSSQPGGSPTTWTGGYTAITTQRAGAAGGPVVRAGSASFNSGSAGSPTTLTGIVVPSGAVAGDWIVIWAAWPHAGFTMTPPSGFTSQTVTVGSSGNQQLFTRVMDGTEGWTPGTTTLTLTCSSGNPIAASIVAVGNTSGPDPQLAGSGNIQTSATITVNGITPLNDGDLILWCAQSLGALTAGTAAGTITKPASVTVRATQSSTTNATSATNVGTLIGSFVQTGHAATGNVNGTDSSSFLNGGVMLAFAPAQYLTVAEDVVAATTALTAGATITSSGWVMAVATLQFQGTGSAFGGGGGSSAGTTGAGAAGVLAVGGTAPDIGGDGGTGSTMVGAAPVAGQAPGGAGGGAASGGAAVQGAPGANGAVIISRTTGQENFSTLIVHVPSPDAPANLSPLVTFGATPVAADGNVEYPVPALVSGVNAGFQGTYTIVAVAGTTAANPWNQPGVPRTLTVSVRQYEYPGGPHATANVSRTFTPGDDDPSGQGILPVGEVTLPIRDIDPGNTSAYYTIMIFENASGVTPPSDLYLDVLFLDTQGQTVIVSDVVDNAYQTYYIDAPASNRDLGRIMGTNLDRTQAVSVMDQCVAISGGPLTLYPGDNVIMVYACEGCPQIGVTYYPSWYLERIS
jgi:hypothetical protein